MKHRLVVRTAFLCALSLIAASALADKGGVHGKPAEARGRSTVARHEGDRPVNQVVTFDRGERTILRGWFSNSENQRGLPPGLAKRERLPPGLAPQLVRNGTLPPGLQEKIQPLPLRIDSQLTPLPVGLRRVVIGNDVVLLDDRTNLILDVVRSVFR
jgi:hypothetical protein